MSAQPPPEIRCLSSTVVYENPWTTVTHDEIERADGGRGVYGVVHKHDFAVVVPHQDGGVHLVQQYRYPIGCRTWELPQGGWPAHVGGPARHDAATALDLAAHELAEETGLRAAHLEVIGRVHPSAGYAVQAGHVVLASGLQPGRTALEPEEFGLVTKFFALDEVWAMVDVGTITDSVTVAALAMAQRRLAAGPVPGAR